MIDRTIRLIRSIGFNLAHYPHYAQVMRRLALGGAWLVLGTLLLYTLFMRTAIHYAADQKVAVLALVSKVLNANIAADSMTLGLDVLSPWVRLNDLRVHTAEGDLVITADLFEFDVDFWLTLRAGRLSAGQIRIKNADIRLLQFADGRIAFTRSAGGGNIDLKRLMEFMRDSETADIQKAKVSLTSELPTLKGRPFVARFDIENALSDSGRTIYLQMTPLAEGVANDRVVLVGDYQGMLHDWETLTGRFRLSTKYLHTSDWRAPIDWFGGQLDLTVRQLDLQLEMNGSEDFVLRVGSEAIQANFVNIWKQPLQMNAPHLTASVQRDAGDWDWQVAAAATGEIGEASFEPFRLAGNLHRTGKDQQTIKLTLDQVEASYLSQFLLGTNIPDDKLVELLTNLEPTAQLNDLRFRFDLQAKRPTQFAAVLDFQQASLQSYQAIPGVNQLSGSLLVFESGGVVEFGSTPFDLALPYLFDAPIEINHGSGEMTFTLLSDDGYFIRGLHLRAATEYADLNGHISLSHPSDLALRTLSVQLGFDHIGQRDRTLELLPTPLSEGVKSWLRTALREADFRRGGVVYHDQIQPGVNVKSGSGKPFDLSSLGLLFDFGATDLKFSEQWPAISAPASFMHVTETGVELQSAKGQIFDLGLSDLDVYVAYNKPEIGHLNISVDGDVAGELSQMMAFVRETSLRDLVGAEVLSWRLDGQAKMHADLSVHLDLEHTDSVVAEGTHIDLRGAVSEASIYVPSMDLAFIHAQGDLRIDSDAGIFSEKMHFETLGGLATAGIRSNWSEPGADQILLKLNGDANNDQLARWLEVPSLNLWQGHLEYAGDATFTLGDITNIQLSLTSGLEGTTIPIPAPFAKAAQEVRPITLLLSTTNATDIIDIQFNTEPGVRGRLEIKDGLLDRGIVRIQESTPLRLPEKGAGLHVTGYIPTASDLGEWTDYIKAVDRSYLQLAEPIPTTVTSVEVKTNVKIKDFVFPNITLNMKRDAAAAAMNIAVNGPGGRGTFVVYDDNSKSIIMHMKELKLKTEAAENADEEAPQVDWLAGIAFTDLSPMAVNIESLLIDNESYGSWQFNVKPEANRVVLSEVAANLRGYKFLNEEKSKVIWTRDEHGDHTTYKGRSKGSNLATIMTAWGYPNILNANTIKVAAEVSWPGSPAMFDWLITSGEVKADLRRGELVGVGESMVSINKLAAFLDISSWVRRLYFDFDDLKSKGIAFDRMTGILNVDEGHIETQEPIRVTGPGNTLTYSGSLDLNTETVDGTMIATLPLAKSLSWGGVVYGVLAAQPIAGLAVWLISRLFKNDFDQISSLNYKVSGSLHDPEIKFDRMFGKEPYSEQQRKKTKTEPDPDLGV